MKNKILGGIYGLLIGDAVGVSYEFKHRNKIHDIDMFPKHLTDKTYPHIEFGTWSDDGAQSLILLESLVEKNALDLNDLLTRFTLWLDQGHMAVNAEVFDVGIQTYTYLQKFKRNKGFELNHHPHESENGNGSLMRCLPLALWHQGSTKELVELAHKQSVTTHPHIRSQVCCALYCVIAKNLLVFGKSYNDDLLQHSVEQLVQIYKDTENSKAIKELQEHILSFDIKKCQGTGYVVDSLMTALQCLKEKNYKQVIQKAVSFGNDTDTTACIAGGLAGIMFGFKALPETWVKGLKGSEILLPLLYKMGYKHQLDKYLS